MSKTKYTINFPIVRFYTENERLPRIPIPNLTYEPKLKHVTTHDIPIPKVENPNRKFIPTTHHVPFSNVHYKHPHLKGLYTH